MSYILLDESGDLGFDFSKKGTTNYFLITFLFCENKRPIEKCVKKTYATLRKKYKKQGKILHAYTENPITRQRLLKCIAGKNCSVLAICLNKKKVYTKLHEEFEDKALQPVDFISRAIFRKYEYRDESYYEMIRKKIVEENPLFH